MRHGGLDCAVRHFLHLVLITLAEGKQRLLSTGRVKGVWLRER